MLTLVVLACLAGTPDQCDEMRLGSYNAEETCQAAGRDWRPAADRIKHAWTCEADGQADRFWIAEVAPGVYVHKGRHAEPGPDNAADTANIGYIIGDDAVAVIDAGGSDAIARSLLADIRARTDLPVRFLILTHMHPDHVFGAGVFAAAGAVILGHPKLPQALAARYPSYVDAYRRDVGTDWTAAAAPPLITPAPERIDLGNRVLELRRHATGHTTNDLSVFDVVTRTWFLGDLVFLDHLPSIDGSVTGWIADLQDAMTRSADRSVPGHGPVSAPWPEAAEPTLDYLTDLTESVRAAIRENTELLDAVTRIGNDFPPGWLLSDTFHPRNVTSAYRELEWE